MKSNPNWRHLSVAVVTVLMSWGVGTAAQALTFTNPNTGNEYFLTDTPSSWTEAQAQAVAAGGNLVTINDAEEQKWLLDVFGSTELFWIGLTDQQTEGVWKWANGEEFTYSNWTPDEPNNAQFFGGQYLGGENYVVMNWQNDGQWNDLANSYIKSRGIVEIVKDCVSKMTHIFDDGSELACKPRNSQ